MDAEVIGHERQLKHTEEDLDAEFDQHNVDVEAILARTQRSFSSRPRIQLYEAPEFAKRLNAFEEVSAGDTVVFECQWKAFPKPTIKWYKDDQEITEDARYVTETPEDMPGIVRLVVNDARKSDEGAYKCKAENQDGVASTTGYMSVSGGASAEEKTLAAKEKKQKKEQKQKNKKQQDDQNAEEAAAADEEQLRKVQSDSKVSYPPHLRTIIEQKSLEEREAESIQNQPPSPIQEFIEKMQSGRGRGATWPYAVLGYKGGTELDDDARSSSSDTSLESQTDYDLVSFEVNTDDDVFTSSDPEDLQQSQEYSVSCVDNDSSVQNDAAGKHVTPGQAPSTFGTISSISKVGDSTARPVVYHMTTKVPDTSTQEENTTKITRSTLVFRNNSPKRKSTEQRQSADRVVMTTQLRPTMDISKLGHVLDSPWAYFLPITSSMTFCASATEMSPVVLVLVMALISLAVFHFLFPKDEKT